MPCATCEGTSELVAGLDDPCPLRGVDDWSEQEVFQEHPSSCSDDSCAPLDALSAQVVFMATPETSLPSSSTTSAAFDFSASLDTECATTEANDFSGTSPGATLQEMSEVEISQSMEQRLEEMKQVFSRCESQLNEFEKMATEDQAPGCEECQPLSAELEELAARAMECAVACEDSGAMDFFDEVTDAIERLGSVMLKGERERPLEELTDEQKVSFAKLEQMEVDIFAGIQSIASVTEYVKRNTSQISQYMKKETQKISLYVKHHTVPGFWEYARQHTFLGSPCVPETAPESSKELSSYAAAYFAQTELL